MVAAKLASMFKDYQTFLGLTLIAIVALGGIAAFTAAPAEDEEVELNGHFEAYEAIDDATGFNDLSITDQALNDTDADPDVDDGNVVLANDINGSGVQGTTVRLAQVLKTSGTIGDIGLTVDYSTAAGLDEDNMTLTELYVVEDEEDEELSPDSSTAIDLSSYIEDDSTVDISEGDASELSVLESGRWVFAAEYKVLNTEGVGFDTNILDWEVSAGEHDADDSDEASSVNWYVDNPSG